jgi:polar amino acid transport system substrate-binding protein
MQRRITALAALTAAALAFALVGCSETGDGGGGGTDGPNGFGDCELPGEAGSIELDPIVDGQLSVVTVLPNPGWWNGTTPENLTDGFEMCMLADIAHRAGLEKMSIKVLSWDQYISGSFTDYDLGAVVTSITEERKAVFTFSDPYYTSNRSVTVQKGSEFDETNIREAKIGTIQSTTNSKWLTDVLKPTQDLALFSDGPEMFAALAAGQVDAIVTDTETALTQSKPYADQLEILGQWKADDDWGMVMPLDTPNVDAVNQALADMKEDGTLAALSEKYLAPLFGIDPASIRFLDAP